MDILGIGGLEFLLLFFLGWVLLGPTQVVKLAREGRKIFNQIRELTQNLSREVNREIDLMTNIEDKDNLESESKEENKKDLPEAYQQFREDFPEEGDLKTSPKILDKKNLE